MLDDHLKSVNEGKVLRRQKRENRGFVLDSDNVKSIMAGVQLDQVLYDLVIRKAAYTRFPMVTGYLEDFFVYMMSQRLEMMFVPLDDTKLAEQLGKVVITSMLQQTLGDRCKTLLTTYPCEYISEEDKRNCRSTPFSPCFSKDNPPPGYGYSQWDMLRSFEETLAYKRAYTAEGNAPTLLIKEQPPPTLRRRKRSPLRGRPKKRPGKKRGSSSSSKSGGSRGSSKKGPMRGPNSPSRKILMKLGAGTGVGAGLGASKVRAGAASPGVFNTLSLQDIRRLNTPPRLRTGSASGTHSLTSGSGPPAAQAPPVALTNIRARPTSLDSFRLNSQLDRSPSLSPSGTSRISASGVPAVPQPVPAPRSGWHPMPPLDPPNYYIPNYKQRPVPQQRRNLAGDRPLTRSSSTSSLASLDTSFGESRSSSRMTNEGGSFLPQVREDFKLHNRVGDSMRTFAERHPYWTKAGRYAGTGLAGLGAYITASQIDRAIQKSQDEAEIKTEEKNQNRTEALEADLLREKLENEKFKQQSEFASKVLTDAIRTGQVPTQLVENVTEQPPVLPTPSIRSYGLLPEVVWGKKYLLLL